MSARATAGALAQVEWKEQALRTLQSQRAALNAMSQTQNQTHARIAAVRGGAFDPKEARHTLEIFTRRPASI